MLRIIALLTVTLSYFAAAPPAAAQRLCDLIVPIHFTAAVPVTEIIPGIANQRIYFCGFMIVQAGQVLEFQISGGTGINCATNNQPYGPRWVLPANSAIVNRVEHAGPYLAFGNALCLEVFGTTGDLTGAFYYAQF